MTATRTAMVLALGLLSPACATTWTVRSTPSPIALQWPQQPKTAKLTLLETLNGFSERKGSRAAFKSFVYGSDRKDEDAFVLPVAVAEGSDGRIAVADLGRRCVHLYIPGQQRYVRLTGTKSEKLVSPVGVAFDDALTLYVSDSAGKVFAFDPDGAFLLTLQHAGAEPLRRPTGLAYSPRTKLLYVVDTLAGRVHAFDAKGDCVLSFGERGEGEHRFNFPSGIFWAPPGELYITNTLAFKIEIFDENGKPLGAFGRHGDGSGDLAMPKGIAVDTDGAVYVVDGLFDNVQLFDRKGDFLLTLGRRGVDLGEFWLPSGAFINGHGELYVCDTYNRRIQVFRITEHYADIAF